MPEPHDNKRLGNMLRCVCGEPYDAHTVPFWHDPQTGRATCAVGDPTSHGTEGGCMRFVPQFPQRGGEADPSAVDNDVTAVDARTGHGTVTGQRRPGASPAQTSAGAEG